VKKGDDEEWAWEDSENEIDEGDEEGEKEGEL
jgi:hypothetical protein